MFTSKKRIYIEQWLDLKPYDKHTSTDNYYLKISNDIKIALADKKHTDEVFESLDNNQLNILACFLASYLEDLVSETNIWNSFIKAHKELYGVVLPYYDVSDYFEGEINIQDVRFLIWYYISSVVEDVLPFPLVNYISTIANDVMTILEREWEYAPENELLKTYYIIDTNEEDFYEVRNLIDRILFKTYLFYPDTYRELALNEFKIIEESQGDPSVITYLQESRDYMLHTARTSLLSFSGKKWTSLIIGEKHSLSKYLLELSDKVLGPFFYKGQDDKNIFIEHIASGKKFELTKKSFDNYDSLTTIDKMLFMGIVRWKNEWWFSGVYFTSDFDADFVLDEKNSYESRSKVSFLDKDQDKIDEMMHNQLTAFKKLNNGQEITFVNAEEVDTHMQTFIQLYNDSLHLSEIEKEQACERVRKDGFFGGIEKHTDFSEVLETGLIFFNPISGLEVAFGINSAFPSENNPFYNEEEREEDTIRLLVSKEYSSELAMYCVKHFGKELPFFKKTSGKKYLENIDFLLRFWKKERYHSVYNMNFIGE